MHHFSWKKAICHSSISALIFLCNVFRLAFFALFCLFNFTRSMMQDDGRDLKCDDKQTLCHNFLPDWRLEVDSRKSLCHLFCKDNIAFCQFSTFVMIPTNFRASRITRQIVRFMNGKISVYSISFFPAVRRLGNTTKWTLQLLEESISKSILVFK